MVDDELVRRVEMLEETAETLKKLPEQMASLQQDVRHLQQDVRHLQRDAKDLQDDVRGLDGRMGTVESQILQLRDEMRVEFSAIRTEVRAGDEATRRVLRVEIREGDEETRRLMRVLHEDVIARIALLGEGRA